MKVRDLSPFGLPAGRAWVCTENLLFDFDASVLCAGSYFINEIVPPDSLCEVQCVVAVDVDSERIKDIRGWRGAFVDWKLLYWVSRENFNLLLHSLTTNDDLCVVGLNVGEEWIQLQLAPAILSDRSSADLSKGLFAGYRSVKVDRNWCPNQVEMYTQPFSLKAQIIRAVATRLKPAKEFLPSKLLHLIYRTLEAIR